MQICELRRRVNSGISEHPTFDPVARAGIWSWRTHHYSKYTTHKNLTHYQIHKSEKKQIFLSKIFFSTRGAEVKYLPPSSSYPPTSSPCYTPAQKTGQFPPTITKTVFLIIFCSSSAHHLLIICSSSAHHQLIISLSSAHHQLIICSSPTHHQLIIRSSSAHY